MPLLNLTALLGLNYWGFHPDWGYYDDLRRHGEMNCAPIRHHETNKK